MVMVCPTPGQRTVRTSILLASELNAMFDSARAAICFVADDDDCSRWHRCGIAFALAINALQSNPAESRESVASCERRSPRGRAERVCGQGQTQKRSD